MTEHLKASGEVFRYSRGEDIRIYRLHVADNGAELWRVTVRSGQPDVAVMEDALTSVDAAIRLLEEIERTLTAGGWRVVQDL